MAVLDYTGAPLAVGDEVRGLADGQEYTGTVLEILPAEPGCDYRMITVQLADRTGHQTFSDAVSVTL